MVKKEKLKAAMKQAKVEEEKEDLIPTDEEIKAQDTMFRGYAKKLTKILKPAWWISKKKKKKKGKK